MIRKIGIGCGGLIVLVMSSCSAATPAPTPRPGSSAVYERIAALTDCPSLQREFDTADANGKRDREAGRAEQAAWATAYMRAADERMKSLKCY